MAVLLEACYLQITLSVLAQRLINVAHACCCKWRLRANVSKARGILGLGGTSSPKIIDLGVAWDNHVLQNGRNNRVTALLISVLRPTLVRCGKIIRLKQQQR